MPGHHLASAHRESSEIDRPNELRFLRIVLGHQHGPRLRSSLMKNRLQQTVIRPHALLSTRFFHFQDIYRIRFISINDRVDVDKTGMGFTRFYWVLLGLAKSPEMRERSLKLTRWKRMHRHNSYEKLS